MLYDLLILACVVYSGIALFIAYAGFVLRREPESTTVRLLEAAVYGALWPVFAVMELRR